MSTKIAGIHAINNRANAIGVALMDFVAKVVEKETDVMGRLVEKQVIDVWLKQVNMFEESIWYLRTSKKTYLKVVSSRLSQVVVYLRIFRLFVKGKFDAYVEWPKEFKI